MEPTPLTLLERLRKPDDAEAWRRFVRMYAEPIHSWARKQGMQDADADDVTQKVLVKLVRLLPTYQRGEGQKFRNWLFQITRNQCRDHKRDVATRTLPGDEGITAVEGGPQIVEFDEAEERRYRLRVIYEVQDKVRSEVSPRTWAAYIGTVLEARPAAKVAAELGMSERAVYLARADVLSRIRRELDGLID